MKNCKSFSLRFPVLHHGKLLLLAALFFFSSCQKEHLTIVSEASPADPVSNVSTERSTTMESQVVEYTQWIINNVGPVVKDQAVYEDIKSGNYTTSRVQAKMVALGFINFSDFSGKLVAKGSAVNAAINSGTLTKEAMAYILAKHLPDLDFNLITGHGGSARAVPTPCYDQLIHHLAAVLIDIAIGAEAGPWGAIGAGVFGVIVAYIDFNDCLDENYGG
jgi:hypothetical protein